MRDDGTGGEPTVEPVWRTVAYAGASITMLLLLPVWVMYALIPGWVVGALVGAVAGARAGDVATGVTVVAVLGVGGWGWVTATAEDVRRRRRPPSPVAVLPASRPATPALPPSPIPERAPPPLVRGRTPLVGYRVWQVVPGEGRGRRHPGEAVPALDCTCGIYASRRAPAPWRVGLVAVGPVELTGRVIEGEVGFRAQRGRIRDPLALWVTCAGAARYRPGTARRETCGARADALQLVNDTLVPVCDEHTPTGSERLWGERWLEEVAAWLKARYQVAVAAERIRP